MNVERADILGRVCAVRSIFLSSRDASPRRATLNARSMGAREVTGVIPGKIGQSGAEIFTNGCGKKAIFERRDQGKLDRRFRISRGFPTTSPACILCGNYPIRLVGHRYLVRLFNRFWKWAHKNVWSPVCQNYAGNAQLYVTFTFASSRRMCSQTERKKTSCRFLWQFGRQCGGARHGKSDNIRTPGRSRWTTSSRSSRRRSASWMRRRRPQLRAPRRVQATPLRRSRRLRRPLQQSIFARRS